MADKERTVSSEWLELDDAEGTLKELEVLKTKNVSLIPPLLNAYLHHIAVTGDTEYSWELLRHLLKVKIESVVEEFLQISPIDEIPRCPNVERFNFAALKSFLLERLASYTRGPPFTIQRICELLTEPTKHHKRLDKYMRALEKNFLVISSVDCFGKPVSLETNVNGIMDSKPITNSLNSSSDEEEEEDEGDAEEEEKIDVEMDPACDLQPVVIVVDDTASVLKEDTENVEMTEPSNETASLSPTSEVSSSSNDCSKTSVDSSEDRILNGSELNAIEPDLTDVNGVDSTSEPTTVNQTALNGELEHTGTSLEEIHAKVVLDQTAAAIPGTVVDL
ncbi:unnamed protein product [Notodromas monacha]|uniref:Serine/threonine-protein phosphatase 4 regulatory subunit 2 n=2 Tax=Notodromas monacha TaxID=399045 RepID=A0A7R9BQF5_9CRUS|nr:unnamed protein product [Notodromas monacha]CAG0918677.1 unnamed protein product [Notodromas monacha]